MGAPNTATPETGITETITTETATPGMAITEAFITEAEAVLTGMAIPGAVAGTTTMAMTDAGTMAVAIMVAPDMDGVIAATTEGITATTTGETTTAMITRETTIGPGTRETTIAADTRETTIAGDTVNATIAVTAADLVAVANGLMAVDGFMAATMAVDLTAGAADHRTMAVDLTAGVADRRTVAEGLTGGATADHLMAAARITVDHPMLTAARTAVATITNTTGNLVPLLD
jgi:hypothetical protein